jgi:hypothetical protein
MSWLDDIETGEQGPAWGSDGPGEIKRESAMCDCQSYNQPECTGSVPEVVLNQARYFSDTGRPTVAVDACIALMIDRLWQAGIRTRHSCCGHNGRFGPASVGLDSANDVPRAADLLRQDGRTWRIFADIFGAEDQAIHDAYQAGP